MAGKRKGFTILEPILGVILKEIHDFSDCESVAIRLVEGDDFPYYVQTGFQGFFVDKENSLHVKDKEGNLVLDADGFPFLECMCGNVLRKRCNPNLSFFTKNGSFWTNCTTKLLGTLTEQERKEIGKTRNTCHHFGYESVALIPMQIQGNSLGLIQINDPRENMFTIDKIEKYELIADHTAAIVQNILELIDEIPKP